jgi:hypothetical protein
MSTFKKYFLNIWNIQKNISIFAAEKISKTNKDASLSATY